MKTSKAKKKAPFSFDEVVQSKDNGVPLPEPIWIAATDGVQLAVRVYHPSTSPLSSSSSSSSSSRRPKAVVVFLHGGGAHSGAGYHHLASKLSSEYGMAVWTPDIRGHGASGGARGDAPSAEQVWNDVRTVLEYAAARYQQEDVEGGGAKLPLLLGGHSSGGSLVINYVTWVLRQQQEGGATSNSSPFPQLSGYLLLSPELGYKSGTARVGRTEFANVNMFAFILNGISGGRFLGHYKAVRFNYPREILLDDSGICEYNTVNMSKAVTPENPRGQVECMQEMLPLGLWVGREDELFDADKVLAYATDSKALSEVTHLGILLNAHKVIGPWIKERVLSK